MTTIKDVAKAAGVSVAMVSKALNNYPDVSPTTREKVKMMAEQMNYSPNVVAKNLSSKNQKTIAMISSGFLSSESLDNSNSFDIFKGVYEATEEAGYELAMYFIESKKQETKDYAKFCRDRNIRGVVLSGIRLDDPYFESLLETNIPCVLIDVKVPNDNRLIGSVSIDNIRATYEIGDYLISNNHHNIAIVSGAQKTDVNTQRMKGISMVADEKGISIEGKIIDGDFKEQTAYENVKHYLTSNKADLPTAIVCFSDIMALGTLKAINEMGLNVPEDISLTGFDGLKIIDYTNPSITTIKQPFREMGYEAAKLVMRIMEGKSETNEKIVPHEMIMNNSVKKLN
ncbi:LacI family DNA-binding transcriptional regulator [Alkalibacterium sp. f15]|uniref:LacI family DNA-binding transcriptional regulator n=1 Tax=Alkalibacterium sp. f15 TaxID=3414029 RepID=UPI003BF82624